ncbi:pilus assembly protein PilO [Bacillus sp. BGMRC 2118]|nr:pilus assembly protein PilO [Bacillus sp. BGMRC 2118]
MVLQFTKKQLILLVSGIVVIGLIYFGVYYLTSSKWTTQKELLSSSINVEDQQIVQLEKKIKSSETETLESTLHLQRKLPVEPIVEQLILDLEKAETVSKSFISSINFTEGSFGDESTLEQFQEFQQKDEDRVEDVTDESKEESSKTPEQSDSTQEGTQESSELTSLGIEKLELTLTVESPSYFEMRTFLNTIENLTRIVRVEELTFTGLEELTSLDQTVQTVKYTVVLSTFYYPELEDLKDQLPQMDTPKPADKVNPLSNYTPKKDDN